MGSGLSIGGKNAPGARMRAVRLGLGLAGLSLCLLFGGCGMEKYSPFGDSSPAPAATPPKPGDGLAEFIGRSAAGARGAVKDPSYGQVQVLVGEAYVSALGETCRKAEISGGARASQPELVAACQRPDKGWRLVPSVMPPQATFQGQK